MPAWTGGDVAKPGDDEMRSCAKWCSLMLASVGNRSSQYPEGCIPLPGDDEQRLLHKINRLKE